MYMCTCVYTCTCIYNMKVCVGGQYLWVHVEALSALSSIPLFPASLPGRGGGQQLMGRWRAELDQVCGSVRLATVIPSLVAAIHPSSHAYNENTLSGTGDLDTFYY